MLSQRHHAPHAHGLAWMVMAMIVVVPSASGADDQQQANARPTAVEQAIIDAINGKRKEAGIPALRVNSRLMHAGRIHARNMQRLMQGGHVLEKVEPQWRTPEARLEHVGYRGFTWGENVFWGSDRADEIVAGWMQSKGHRANLLNPRFNDVGVGQAGRRFGSYVCAVFGASTTPSDDKDAARRGVPRPAPVTSDVSWRYRWHNGRWWYWLPSNRWVVWSNGQWVAPERREP